MTFDEENGPFGHVFLHEPGKLTGRLQLFVSIRLPVHYRELSTREAIAKLKNCDLKFNQLCLDSLNISIKTMKAGNRALSENSELLDHEVWIAQMKLISIEEMFFDRNTKTSKVEGGIFLQTSLNFELDIEPDICGESLVAKTEMSFIGIATKEFQRNVLLSCSFHQMQMRSISLLSLSKLPTIFPGFAYQVSFNVTVMNHSPFESKLSEFSLKVFVGPDLTNVQLLADNEPLSGMLAANEMTSFILPLTLSYPGEFCTHTTNITQKAILLYEFKHHLANSSINYLDHNYTLKLNINCSLVPAISFAAFGARFVDVGISNLCTNMTCNEYIDWKPWNQLELKMDATIMEQINKSEAVLLPTTLLIDSIRFHAVIEYKYMKQWLVHSYSHIQENSSNSRYYSA